MVTLTNCSVINVVISHHIRQLTRWNIITYENNNILVEEADEHVRLKEEQGS